MDLNYLDVAIGLSIVTVDYRDGFFVDVYLNDEDARPHWSVYYFDGVQWADDEDALTVPVWTY